MPSGLIKHVLYETSDPLDLSDAAEKLASSPDSDKVSSRFGLGVCSLGPDASGKSRYSVFIATYESKWKSFWRIFWE
jgi:quercetin dioxygenase-like cupin family protein